MNRIGDHSWAQRLITVLAGVAIVIVGDPHVLGIPELKVLGFFVAGWGIPMPAESNPRPSRTFHHEADQPHRKEAQPQDQT
jgi:hypothetical protein